MKSWTDKIAVTTDWTNSSLHENAKGIGWMMAAVFIIADMMGAGMIALPVALGQAGIIPGLILLIGGALCSGFTGVQLSDNWVFMQHQWPEYRKHTRRPYPEMARRALGPRAKILMEICMAITLYGIVTVLMLLSSNNISLLLKSFFGLNIHICIILLVVAAIVWPFTLLKSPMHFWQAGLLAAVASAIAAFLIVLGISLDAPSCISKATLPEFSWSSLFRAYGTMVFAYGGHSAFPTIQVDMRRPVTFTKSVISSYIFILVTYILIAVGGLIVYGNSIETTIIPTIQTVWISDTVNILITLHVLPAIIIVISPLFQLVEEWTKTSHKFGPGRIIVRSFLLLLCLFTALSCPRLNVLLDIVGGSTVTLMTMMLPSIFWLYLMATKTMNEEHPTTEENHRATFKDVLQFTPKRILFVNVISLVFGFVGGVCATVTSILALFDTGIDPPCYISLFNGNAQAISSTNSSIVQ